MMREEIFKANSGVSINYAEGPPSGPPLLFLHGLGADWRHIRPVLPYFAADWHVYASDMRGHGRSGRSSRYRLIDYVADNVDLLRRQVNAPAVLVGTSLGANVAAAVASTATDLVRAIVLEDPSIFDHTPSHTPEPIEQLKPQWSDRVGMIRADRSIIALRRELTRRYPEMDGLTVRDRARRLHHLDPAVLKEFIEDTILEGFEPKFDRIRCPVLILRADPTTATMCSDRGLEITRAQIPDLAVTDVPGSDHVIRNTHPLEFVRRTIMFLETI